MKYVNIVNEWAGSSHMVYTVAVGYFSHFSKIFLVIFPPHCTHHLQSFDVVVTEHFKAEYTVAQNDWMTANPGGKKKL